MKKLISISLIFALCIVVLSGCGGDSPDLSGKYTYDGDGSSVANVLMGTTYIEFTESGDVTYHQSQCDFTGTYKKSGSKYVATFDNVDGPSAMINNIVTVANGKDWKMDITPTDDGALLLEGRGLLASSLGIDKEIRYAKE